ncbi:MAG: hypothetical protein A2896_01865 [Candidatus Nealsonbacteria bacterium RIFCSPLOWO2_01_FULL_43_32]|uniref:PsbP C-terminal domain-containing protein n=1 Tax=Candidatus Nealsonbacteria bacterium RIFCSPLOWO2_01_FULL_43_32 TaxID=1801672 RepID=A0A1G2EH16_9BACT|nr:MAG: hypothetical protein A2896_01865 [Candidatus Nealsonbacteria bacterium RIFCSPLOWO2_01_FULL_43_32]
MNIQKHSKILIILVVLTALAGAGFFVYKNLAEPKIAEDETLVAVSDDQLVIKEAAPEATLLVKDDFQITLPPGWQEVQEVKDFPGVLTMAVDAKEEIQDEKAKNIDFQTNFSIKRDDLAKYSSLSGAADYVKSIKDSLAQLIPGINFTHEEQRTIGGRNAFFIECESTQQEIDFKTLLVFIEGNNQTIWAISFNTFQDSWTAYRDLFYQTAESFRLKYQLEL